MNTTNKKKSHASNSRVDNYLGNKALELINIINHRLGELEKKEKKTQRRLG